jgi:hypothetical protein
MSSTHRFAVISFFVLVLGHGASIARAAGSAEAEQLRIVQVMAEGLRARIGDLPVLLAPAHPLGKIEERTVTLNRAPVIVEGQRFDGLVVTAPDVKASYAWAFASPPNVASWYVVREQGETKGFSNFVRRPRASLPNAAEMKPQDVPMVTLQKLDSDSWSPGARYILWFRFTNDTPAEFSLRAAFFPTVSLNNNRLPALLFPAGTK